MGGTKLYMYDQNNSGGSFVVDLNLSHRVVIEATSETEAEEIALDLGIYFDGCNEGTDCPCCGDRWYNSPDDLEEFMSQYGVGCDRVYPVGFWDHEKDVEKRWQEVFGMHHIVKEPEWSETSWGSKKYEGSIQFKSVDDYLQFMADEYGWETPDIIVHYKDGSKKTFSGRKRR